MLFEIAEEEKEEDNSFSQRNPTTVIKSEDMRGLRHTSTNQFERRGGSRIA
jgi:hypothetical protein